MSFTIQQIVDRARVPLNDSEKIRYPDDELLMLAQDAYLMIVRYRPDMFLGQFTALPSFSSLTLESTFPVTVDMYLPAIADYVTARAEFKDDEHIVKERAQGFYALFGAGVRG